MKKVVNVSVGGRSFSLDDDAYERLTAYFDHFKARLGSDSQSAKEEVMSDLENRIADLFDQGTGGVSYRVVSLALVNKVVDQLGMPDGSKEPFTTFSEETAGEGPDFSYSGVHGTVRRRLFRDTDNGKISGVCAGLAAFLNLDITLVRIIALIALLLWGTGFLVYVVLWVVVPPAKTPAEKCEMRGFEPTAENMARFGQGRSGYGK